MKRLISTMLLAFALVGNLSAQERYNVLFIAVDDMNDWPTPFGGHPQAITPNMDRLSDGGLVFNKAYCSATVCGPSRSSLMTGFRPSSSGVYGNKNNLKHAPVTKDVLTIPQYFSANGYTTVSMGKIFHQHGEDQGQWAWDIWNKAKGSGAPPKKDRPINGLTPIMGEGLKLSAQLQLAFDWGATSGKDEQTKDMATSLWFADQLKQEFDKPFFMGVGISKPHLPWFVPQKYFDMYPLDEIIVPEFHEDDLDDILTPSGTKKHSPSADFLRVKKANKFKEATQAYLANITYVDDCIGILLDALENSAYAQNTIIVMWGDHGWYLGEKLKYRKTSLWEEASRVPLIIKVPNTLKGKTKTNGIVNLQDLYPTLNELCQLPPKQDIEGTSFAPLFKNPNMKWDTPTLTTMGYKNHSVRSDRYRYIRWEDGTEELYDHENDPMEWTNLAANKKYKKVISDLKTYLPKKNHLEITVPVPLGDPLFVFRKNNLNQVSTKVCTSKVEGEMLKVFFPNKGAYPDILFPLKLKEFEKTAFAFKLKFLNKDALPNKPIAILATVTADGIESRPVRVYIDPSTEWQEVKFNFSIPFEKLLKDNFKKTLDEMQQIKISFKGKNRYLNGEMLVKDLGVYKLERK